MRATCSIIAVCPLFCIPISAAFASLDYDIAHGMRCGFLTLVLANAECVRYRTKQIVGSCARMRIAAAANMASSNFSYSVNIFVLFFHAFRIYSHSFKRIQQLRVRIASHLN